MAWVAVTGYEAAKVLAYVKANDRVPEGYNVKYDRDPVVQKLDTVTGFDFEDPEAEFAIDNGPGPGSVTLPALAADVAAAIRDLVTPPPSLLLAPAGSRDASGTITPTVSGSVTTTPGAYDDAWSLVAGTTNLHRNPSIEANLDYLQASSGLTMTRDTTSASHGSASAKVVAVNGASGKRLLQYHPLLTPLTGVSSLISSVDVWGSGTVQVEISGDYSDATTFGGARSEVITLTGSPVRIPSPPVTINPAKTVSFVRTSIWVTSDAITLNADGWQVEQGTVATPYTDTARVPGTVSAPVPPSFGAAAAIPIYDPGRTIAFVGDIHFGKGGAAERRAAAQADMAAINPLIAHRVYVGDLTESFGTVPSQTADAKVWITSIGPTGHWDVIAGNHDYGGPGTAPRGDDFAATWGYSTRHWTRDMGDFVLVGLNQREHGPITGANTWMMLFSEDLAYLDTALGSTDKDCIICFHAPLWGTVRYGAFPSSDPRYGANPDADIKAILNKHLNARMWVSGHTHTATGDPRIFALQDVGSRSIVSLNCSAISNVLGVTGGISGTGPIYAPVVTIDPDRILVRWRDHEHGVWASVRGEAWRALPARGDVVIRYLEDGVLDTEVLTGPGRFGGHGIASLVNGSLVLSTDSATLVESVSVYPYAVAPDRGVRMTRLREAWTYANAQGANNWNGL